MRKLTQKEITKTLKNPNTRVLIEWLDKTIKITNSGGKIMSDKFFHQSHDRIDRVVLNIIIPNYFTKISKLESWGKDGLIIHIK